MAACSHTIERWLILHFSNNDSSLPFTEARTNPLSVIRKAIIVTPNDAERRIVNSTMLAVGDGDEIGQEQQQDFVSTDKISPKVY